MGQFEKPGWIVEGFERPGELGGHNRREHASALLSTANQAAENKCGVLAIDAKTLSSYNVIFVVPPTLHYCS
jgi:hypothetical protein